MSGRSVVRDLLKDHHGVLALKWARHCRRIIREGDESRYGVCLMSDGVARHDNGEMTLGA
jgi:hypothetical protein